MMPLAIIPARAGSRRLPNKNLMQIGGTSLIGHAVLAADHALGFHSRVIVNTDYSVPYFECPWPYRVRERPAHLCGPDVPMTDVVRDTMAFARECGMEFDSIVLLQPTSPLRTGADVGAALKLLETSDAVISVVDSDLPELFTVGHAGRLRLMELAELADGRRVVRANGAIFAAKAAVFDRGHDWWTADVVTAYPMPAERSVDIDTIVDFEEATALWNKANT